MSAPENFAVVIEPEAVRAMASSPSVAGYAVCVVTGDAAICHLVETRQEVERLVGSLPVAPSGYSCEAALLPFEVEAEAIALLADEIASLSALHQPSKLPDGFLPGMPRLEGGLKVRLTEYGLDIAVSLALASGLGWREGDGLMLGASPCGRFIAMAKGPGGPALVREVSDPGMLQIDRDLSGVPLGIELGQTDWVFPQYQTREGAIVLAAADLTRRKPVRREEVTTVVLPPDQPRTDKKRWIVTAFAALAFFAGWHVANMLG